MEIVRLIEEGETFEGYRADWPLWQWKEYQRAKAHGTDVAIADKLCAVLKDQRTPAAYRQALEHWLCELTRLTKTGYDAHDLRETYLRASAMAMVEFDRNNNHAPFNARSNVLELLYGLRKKKPISTPNLRTQRTARLKLVERAVPDLETDGEWLDIING